MASIATASAQAQRRDADNAAKVGIHGHRIPASWLCRIDNCQDQDECERLESATLKGNYQFGGAPGAGGFPTSYSWRSVTIGSTRAARRAGRYAANAKTTARLAARSPYVGGSVGATP